MTVETLPAAVCGAQNNRLFSITAENTNKNSKFSK